MISSVEIQIKVIHNTKIFKKSDNELVTQATQKENLSTGRPKLLGSREHFNLCITA